MEFKLRGECIELDNVLKAAKLAASGAEAREHIQSGSVRVNGAPEMRIRRKLRAGDVVDFCELKIMIVA